MSNVFSPSPWEIKRGSDKFGPTIWIDSNGGNYVCELVRTSDFNEQANARLIAAAPDLYAACKLLEPHARKILDELATLCESGKYPDEVYVQAKQLIDAIDKVEQNEVAR